MPYQLISFNTVVLPQAMTKDDLSTGKVPSTLERSIGGVYDTYGARRRWPLEHEFVHKGLYYIVKNDGAARITTNINTRVTTDGDTRIVAVAAPAQLRELTDNLKAQIGNRGQLLRRRFPDGALTWKTCRLLRVQHVEEVKHAGTVSDVESHYATAMVGWHAESASEVSGSAAPGIPAVLAAPNVGLLPIYDGVLSIARTSGTISQVVISGAGIDITWTGSIGAGQTLVIDAGAQTVTIGGGDQFAGFVLGATAREWLPLEVGINFVTVNVVGGNATITLSYYDQWP